VTTCSEPGASPSAAAPGRRTALPVLIWAGGRERRLEELDSPIALDALVRGGALWEVEIGFGKGRFLLRRAAEDRGGRFLGIELASKYYRLLRDRAGKRDLRNLALIRGEALYLLSAAIPRAFAAAVHVYFPDPWPKSRHHKRRLFDAETVDLVLGLLAPGASLFFATDHPAYGAAVRDLLLAHRGLLVDERRGPWPGGARTNYEAKYEAEGRPIVRLEVRAGSGGDLLHPAGRAEIVAATAPRRSPEEEAE
jgi:tRNA (guanine-N7-)-methyltransferase